VPRGRTLWFAIAFATLLTFFAAGFCARSLADGEPDPAGTPRSALAGVAVADLPEPARATLDLIDAGGPFPYPQDGSIFGNREGRLPERPRGYYREYTVPTPGEPDRGARRLVVGQDGDIYYTDDHYRSFRQVLR